MSEPFLHDLQIGAAMKEPRRVGAPQIMDPDAGEAACLADGSPYLMVKPVGRDMAVGVPGPRRPFSSGSVIPGGGAAAVLRVLVADFSGAR